MPEHKAASVEIKIFDAEGLPVAFPAVLDLETSYIFQTLVTNKTTTRGGQPWEALLEVGIGISLDSWHRVDLVPYSISTAKFAPNQSVGFVPEIYVKSDYAGMAGKVTAKVFDAFDGILASAVKRFGIGHETSPYIKYRVPGKILATRGMEGIDMPFLNPTIDNSEGVVMAGVGSRPPPPPPPQPAPIDYTKSKSPPGLDLSSKPEPPVEFEGETAFGGRLG